MTKKQVPKIFLGEYSDYANSSRSGESKESNDGNMETVKPSLNDRYKTMYQGISQTNNKSAKLLNDNRTLILSNIPNSKSDMQAK